MTGVQTCALPIWLSRDPLKNAELEQGPNLYAYGAGNPVNVTDPLGLCCDDWERGIKLTRARARRVCIQADEISQSCSALRKEDPKSADALCAKATEAANLECEQAADWARHTAFEFVICWRDSGCGACPQKKPMVHCHEEPNQPGDNLVATFVCEYQ